MLMSPTGAPVQIFPPRARPDVRPHDPDVVPQWAAPKDWPELQDHIVPSLRGFYNREKDYPVSISDAQVCNGAEVGSVKGSAGGGGGGGGGLGVGEISR